MIEIGEYCIDIETIIEWLTPIIVVFIVYLLGLKAYYKQKEYENVRSRYLENGVELVIAQIDYVLGVFRHNWMLLLRTTRQYRELESQVSAEDFKEQFREVDQDKFQLAPIYKTKPLLKDDVLWRAYQEVFAFVGTTNNEIKSDYLGSLNNALQDPEYINKQGFIEEFEKFAKEINQEASKYYLILGILHEIAEILEKGKFTFKEIDKLHKKSEFIKIVAELNSIFPNKEPPNE